MDFSSFHTPGGATLFYTTAENKLNKVDRMCSEQTLLNCAKNWQKSRKSIGTF